MSLKIAILAMPLAIALVGCRRPKTSMISTRTSHVASTSAGRGDGALYAYDAVSVPALLDEVERDLEGEVDSSARRLDIAAVGGAHLNGGRRVEAEL